MDNIHDKQSDGHDLVKAEDNRTDTAANEPSKPQYAIDSEAEVVEIDVVEEVEAQAEPGSAEATGAEHDGAEPSARVPNGAEPVGREHDDADQAAGEQGGSEFNDVEHAFAEQEVNAEPGMEDDGEDLSRIIEELCLSKAEEFAMLGYEGVTGKDIWEFVSEQYDKDGIPPLHRLINDILSLRVTNYMNWLTLSAYKGIKFQE